jgi:hypothetical protein
LITASVDRKVAADRTDMKRVRTGMLQVAFAEKVRDIPDLIEERAMQLYHFPSPNPQKVTFALKELGLDCELLPVDLAKRGTTTGGRSGEKPVRTRACSGGCRAYTVSKSE